MDTDRVVVLPAEMLIKIFKNMSGKELFACTKVCKQWQNVIKDIYAANNYKWHQSIKSDFNMDLEEVKTIKNMSLYNLYYNLSKWPDVATAIVKLRELYTCTKYQYIQGFQLLRDGVIAVHRNTEILYYDVHKGSIDESRTIAGVYKQYYENDYTLVTLGENNTLNVVRKCVLDQEHIKSYEITSVKYFTLTNDKIYVLTSDNYVRMCDLDFDLELLNSRSPIFNTAVKSLKYKQNLYILTNYSEVLCCYGDNKEKSIVDPMNEYSPDNEYVVLNKLYKLGILDFLNCSIYKKILYWTKSENNFVKTHEVSVLFATGKMVFVGNMFGVLQLYHFPDEIDFTNSRPLKEWDLSDHSESNECPIIQIGVLEDINCHIVIVAMPHKLVAIELHQDFNYIYQEDIQ